MTNVSSSEYARLPATCAKNGRWMKLWALVLATHQVANAISRTEGRIRTRPPTISGDQTSTASANDVRCGIAEGIGRRATDAIGTQVVAMTRYLSRAARN